MGDAEHWRRSRTGEVPQVGDLVPVCRPCWNEIHGLGHQPERSPRHSLQICAYCGNHCLSGIWDHYQDTTTKENA